VKVGWASAEFSGPNGVVPIPPTGRLTPRKSGAIDAVVASVPSELTYNIKGKGYTRFRATFAIDDSSLTSDINASVRAFVFNEPPNKRQLINVTGERPVEMPPKLDTPDQIVTRVYQHALGRNPNAEERRIAGDLLKSGVDGLEDLLWAIFLSPEFQFIS
jgi:hypothetical protein